MFQQQLIKNEIDSHVAGVLALTHELFTEGPRGIFLMNRTKDGGGSTEEKRLVRFDLYNDSDKFRILLTQYMTLKKIMYPTARIYVSVNTRDIFKSVRTLENQLLDAHYYPDEQKLHTYNKLLKSSRTVLMQPNSRAQTMFLLDIDDVDNDDGTTIDLQISALRHLSQLNVKVIHSQRTKNGWHIVTEPFNPALWDNSLGELKKDALLCIAW